MPCEHKCHACGERLATQNTVLGVGAFNLGAVIFVVIVFALVLLLAPKAHGQTHPVDEVYVPAALNIVNGPSSFRSDLTIRNATGDPIIVNFFFYPVNTFASGSIEVAVPFGLWIGPYATMPMPDALATLGLSGQGMLILDACVAGADCSRKVEDARELAGQPSQRRAIGVTSQVCGTVVGIGTHCEAQPIVPFNEYVSSEDRAAGLDHVAIVGIKVDARYSTKIGVANMTIWSSTVAVITLGDGAGNIRGQAIQRLGPFESWYPSAQDIFPILTQLDCSDALHACKPVVKNPWIRVDQTDTIPLPGADVFGCVGGCPRFYAWADVADRVTHSVTPLQIGYDVPDPSKGFCAQNIGACGGLAPHSLAMYARSVIPTLPDPNGPQTAAYANRLIDLTQNAYARLRRLGDQLGDPVVIMAAVAAARPVVVKASVHRRLEKE